MIHLDIHKVKIPHAVKLSKIASCISEECRLLGVKIPPSLRVFVERHDRDMAGYDWDRRLMEAAHSMSTDLLNQWVAILPSSMCRAEMRGILKRRLDSGCEGEAVKDVLSGGESVGDVL